MKTNLYKIAGVLFLGLILLMNACKEDYYSIDNSFYDNMQIKVRNPLLKGDVIDTLQIEISNVDLIMIEEVSDPDFVFFAESFIFKVEHDSIATVDEEGNLTPVSRGTTRLDITFRSNPSLSTAIIIEVYREYRPVTEIQVPSAVTSTIIEVGESYDLASMLIVLPVNADNKKLHFTMSANSTGWASITDDGIITGIGNSGRNKATIQVVSDDNPEVKASFGVQVVNEILISSVNVVAGLDGAEIGLGETIDLNLCTFVLPSTVNEKNKKLTFTLLEGESVLSLDENGVIKAIGYGTARLKATSKNNMSKEFSIVVKAGLTDLLRLFWTVTTSVSYGYVPDGTTGMAKDMFDNNNTTFFGVTKPGKTYNDCHTPADHIPYFVVDMKSAQTFNYIRWNHRTNSSYDYLRVWGIDIAGSNDGETWTDIQSDIAIPYANYSITHYLTIPESTYRYVKVMLTKWSDNSGGSTSGSTMQIAEFGLGYK